MHPAFAALTHSHSAARLLSRALQREQLSHAYLLKGREAEGLALALALAQSLFCPQQGCLNCAVCESIAQGQYPDLYVIQGEGTGQNPTLKLSQIQRLNQQVALPPVQSQQQIFVLQHAEFMNKESSNALLKTLEEPASDSIIFLLTRNLDRILPTLRSRSQILSLGRSYAESAEIEAQTEAELWHWEQLERINDPRQLGPLEAHLSGLKPTDLALQMQLFQRECWHKIQPFIVQKQSVRGLRRAQRYLSLFDSFLTRLKTHAHPKLLVTSFAQDFVSIRSQR